MNAIAEIMRRLAALERRIPSGPMVSTAQGGTEIRPYQTGMPVELTSAFNTNWGYSWKALFLDTASSSTASVTDAASPLTGHLAFTPDNLETLPIGTRGWLEIDPQSRGWIFIVGATTGGVDPDGSAAVGSGWIFGFPFDRCLLLTVLGSVNACDGIDDAQEILLAGDGVDSWNSTSDFTYDTGSGPVELTRSGGMPHLTIDGIEVGYDNAGRDADGYFLDFVAQGEDFCDGDDPEGVCDLSHFRVRLRCVECPDECCPDDAPPSEVHMTLTSAACPALDRVVTLTRITSSQGFRMWYAPAAADRWWVVYCNETIDTYELLIQSVDPLSPDTPVTCFGSTMTLESCDPLHLTLEGTFNPTAGSIPACLGLTCPNPTDLLVDVVE